MDGLIVILVILGLISSVSKKKKARRQQEQARARQAGYDEIPAVPPPLMREDAPEEKPAKPMTAASEQIKIPFTKEEWAAFLSDHSEKQPVRSAKAAAPADTVEKQSVHTDSAEGRKFQTLAAQPLHAERLRPVAQHFEGESHREHAAHRQRIAEEEARLHREREELQELRNVNLKKLRSAVVMSEVLGKPVALRGRR